MYIENIDYCWFLFYVTLYKVKVLLKINRNYFCIAHLHKIKICIEIVKYLIFFITLNLLYYINNCLIKPYIITNIRKK